MKTNVKKSAANSRKSEKVNASSVNLQVINESAPVGSGTTSGGASPALVLPAVGVAAPAKVRQTGASQLAAAIDREDTIKLGKLTSAIVSRFLPSWSGASAVRASLLPLLESGVINDEQFEKMFAAAGRAAGVVAPFCSYSRVIAVIREQYRKEFESVCGCSLDSLVAYYRGASAVGLASSFEWVVSKSLVTSDAVQNDFIKCTSINEGTPTQIVRAVLSFRFLAEFLHRSAAAAASDNSELLSCLASVYRCASRLGFDTDRVIDLYKNVASSTAVLDEKDTEKLQKNLAKCREDLKVIEGRLMVLLPSLAVDGVIPSGAVLPSDLPTDCQRAKIRKAWNDRGRKISAISTLENSLQRC